jgi:hypothetical protein
MPNRRWRISATIPFPRQLVVVEPGEAGEAMPQKLGMDSRVPSQRRELDGVTTAIRRMTDPRLPEVAGLADQYDAAELLVEIDAESAFEALERAHPLLDLILDRLSFDLQATLTILQTNVRDVTPPVAVGDERDVSIFASYPGDKFARAEDLGSTSTEQTPSLADSYDEPGPRVRAALRWYVKALGTPFLHDRFIFLWIATEIFADNSGIAVNEPLPLRCGHELTECPTCHKPTDRKVRGMSIRAYLEARGADSDLALKAWRLRQMLHGAIPFDSDQLVDLGAIVQVLRAIAASELKQALGIPTAKTPIVIAGVPSIHPSMAAMGHGPITEPDLSWPE